MVRTNQAEQTYVGLGDYSGYYGTVAEFLELTEDEWFQMLTEGCRRLDGGILTIQEDAIPFSGFL